MALNFGCYMLIEISKFVHGKNVPAKMTVHIGFENLSMTVTTCSNISSYMTETEMTVHIGFLNLCTACASIPCILDLLFLSRTKRTMEEN